VLLHLLAYVVLRYKKHLSFLIRPILLTVLVLGLTIGFKVQTGFLLGLELGWRSGFGRVAVTFNRQHAGLDSL